MNTYVRPAIEHVVNFLPQCLRMKVYNGHTKLVSGLRSIPHKQGIISPNLFILRCRSNSDRRGTAVWVSSFEIPVWEDLPEFLVNIHSYSQFRLHTSTAGSAFPLCVLAPSEMTFWNRLWVIRSCILPKMHSTVIWWPTVFWACVLIRLLIKL